MWPTSDFSHIDGRLQQRHEANIRRLPLQEFVLHRGFLSFVEFSQFHPCLAKRMLVLRKVVDILMEFITSTVFACVIIKMNLKTQEKQDLDIKYQYIMIAEV